MSTFNVAEFYYILHRWSRDLAEERERNLRVCGLELVPVNDNGFWKEAAKTKSACKGAAVSPNHHS